MTFKVKCFDKPVTAAVAFIDNPDIPIIRIQLVTIVNLTNVTIDIELVDELPLGIAELDGVYKYLRILASCSSRVLA